MKKFFLSLICITAGLLLGGLILKFAGIDAIEAYKVMWNGAFSRPGYIANIIIRSTPLILTGLSVAFAFRTGLFNIGAEGQFIMGALSAAFFGVMFNFNPWIQIPAVIFFSLIVSGIYGGFAGFLKARFGVHEVISTIMLNWIALYFSNYMVQRVGFHKPGTETSEYINPSTSLTFFEDWKSSDSAIEFFSRHSLLGEFMRPSVNAGILFALVAAIIVWFILKKTTFGFKLKAVGSSIEAARYAGINVNKKMTQSMMISGALSGLAGATHVMGVSKNVAILAAHEGYGFDGIAVSLIGANSPMGSVLAGFFLGGLKYSGQKLQSALEAPSEVIGIMIGAIIFFIAIPIVFEKPLNKLFLKVSKKWSQHHE
ncbi:MAG: ABC transporter permease [Bacteriovorax sp.]|jgi:simple sugar transport system permease protein